MTTTTENENRFPALTCCGGLYAHRKDCPKATTRNEAAERLLEAVGHEARFGTTVSLLVRDALAAERRATVERIRNRLEGESVLGGRYSAKAVDAILDEEAAR